VLISNAGLALWIDNLNRLKTDFKLPNVCRDLCGCDDPFLGLGLWSGRNAKSDLLQPIEEFEQALQTASLLFLA
jgi:hypothetical protein